MAAQRIVAFLDTLEFEVMDRAAEECAREVIPYLADIGPRPQKEVHTYSTGAMSISWEVTRIGPALYLVYNTQDYSGYADEGYTRYGGKGSALPWRLTGGEDYTAKAVAAVRPDWENIVMEALRDATG